MKCETCGRELSVIKTDSGGVFVCEYCTKETENE